MMAYGFQSSLGVRAVQEEFTLTATGFLMSGYFIGYFIGAATIPNIISRVGHIRSFCFCIIIIFSYFNSCYFNKSIYLVFIKVLTGISMVCIYTVAESWLNDRSSNKNRECIIYLYGYTLWVCGYWYVFT